VPKPAQGIESLYVKSGKIVSEAFDILRWAIGVAALILGCMISLGNWITLIGVIVTKRSSSFVPFVGGVSAAIGIFVLPISGLWKWAWIPLVADFQSLPITAWTCAMLFLKKIRSFHNKM
jgi:hypothetical protein